MSKSQFTMLFQGDSITDAGRDRTLELANDPAAMGSGYAYLAMCRWLAEHPDPACRVFNRGVSGDRVFDLAQRWQHDCLRLSPDLISILIGINDLWHQLNGESHGTPTDYATQYDALLFETRAALPHVHLVVCEPFILTTGVVDASWFPEFLQRRAIAENLAEKYSATWVPFHRIFEAAVANGTDPAYWATDGVHPTPQGHWLMAKGWCEAVQARRA